MRIARGLRLFLAIAAPLLPNVAQAQVLAGPTPTPTPLQGGCEQGGLAAITNRPGLGREVTIDGSPCTVPAGHIVLEAGFRSQATTAIDQTSWLSTYPSLVARFGLPARNEIIFLPPLSYAMRSGANFGGTFVPASGVLDMGVGFKHTLLDAPGVQTAVEAFVTLPSGYPSGPTGFTFNVPTYLTAFSATFALGGPFGLTTTQNASWTASPGAGTTTTQYFSYQPSLGLSYALSPSSTLLVQDQISAPSAPGGPGGNRGLVGVQHAAGPNLLFDLDFEQNFLPVARTRQNAFDVGLTVLF